MDKIENMYNDWICKKRDSDELKQKYKKLTDTLSNLLGFSKFNEIDDMIMECVIIESLESFKAGFEAGVLDA